jgi:hypothetical protein
MRRLFNTTKFFRMQPSIFQQPKEYNWKYISMVAALSAGLVYHKSESKLFKPLSFNFLNSAVATCDAPELSEDQDEREN